jgi:hypothetical protein
MSTSNSDRGWSWTAIIEFCATPGYSVFRSEIAFVDSVSWAVNWLPVDNWQLRARTRCQKIDFFRRRPNSYTSQVSCLPYMILCDRLLMLIRLTRKSAHHCTYPRSSDRISFTPKVIGLCFPTPLARGSKRPSATPRLALLHQAAQLGMQHRAHQPSLVGDTDSSQIELMLEDVEGVLSTRVGTRPDNHRSNAKYSCGSTAALISSLKNPTRVLLDWTYPILPSISSGPCTCIRPGATRATNRAF